jgi:hypothetical protein
MKKKEKKELEKFLKTLPPEIISTLGIVIGFTMIGILHYFAIPKNLTKIKKVS